MGFTLLLAVKLDLSLPCGTHWARGLLSRSETLGQVLRFYGFFQETVTEHPIENSRYRHVNIMYHMEDGSLSMTEPKTKNSGLPQGTFLKRQKTMREDGLAYIGPDDLRVGSEITIHGRTIHINGCDRFTRWFLESAPKRDAGKLAYQHWASGS